MSTQLNGRASATARNRLLFIFAIMVAGFNLRPAITSVGPLLGTIRDQIGLANWSAGTITSLPLIAFAIVSPLVPKISRRLGNVPTILLGLILLLGGIGIRSIPYTSTLFFGTAIVGIGIAVMNVLLPAIIKEKFPNRVGRMTSIYSTSMVIFAAGASGLSVPLAKSAGLGWELSLLSWGMLAVVGIVMWIFVMRKETPDQDDHIKLQTRSAVSGNLWKSSLAWQVTFFMGLQSLLFYVTVSWLPEILHSYGISVAMAGWLVSYAQFVSLPTTFLTPILAEKLSSQKGIVLGIGALMTIGFSGLLFGGSLPLLVLWVTLIGLASGGSISLSLALLSMRAKTAQDAGELSGMAQSIGYVFAAVGPLLVGLLFDLTHAWHTAIIAMVVVGLLMTLAGLGAGRNKFVLEE